MNREEFEKRYPPVDASHLSGDIYWEEFRRTTALPVAYLETRNELDEITLQATLGKTNGPSR